MRPFRFGSTLRPVMKDRRTWTDTVKLVESSGFGAVTVIDHFGSSGGIFASLLSAADAAPSLKVGTLVLNIDFWNPSLLAREVITADVLTDGRFELGLGAGWNEADYRAMGLARAPAATRVAKLDEAIGVLRLAFAGGPIRHAGEHYTIETEAWPRPVSDPIRLVVGGGSRRILELAARQADVVSLHRNLQRGTEQSWANERERREEATDPVAERVGWVRAAAGDRFEELELHALLQRVVVTDRRREAAAELGEELGLDADAILDSPHFLVGTTDEIVADLEERRERWGISYWTLVGAELIDDFTPVVRRLAGT